MNPFDRYFFAPYRAARAYLFARVFLAMVALDTFLLMIGHAGRYGVDGFNVAHFALLDRVAPLPSARLYIAVLLCTGLLALAAAFGGAHPAALFGLFVLYTFSWSMSMLDSYQHHYFVSAVLLCLVFFPTLNARDVRPSEPARKKRARPDQRELGYVLACAAALTAYALIGAPSHPWLWFFTCAAPVVGATWLRSHQRRKLDEPARVTGFGFNLLAATTAIVYTFTSIAKMDAEWCRGFTLRRISSAEQVFAPLANLAQQLGLPHERFWSLLSTSVIPVELFIALGYALAPLQDASRSRVLRAVSWTAACLAFTLHLGAEAMGLQIGWFSYYMLLLACAFLLPGRAVESLASILSLPAHKLALWLEQDDAPRASEAIWMVLGVCMLLGVVGYLLDLPGSGAAAVAAMLVLLVLAAVSLPRGAAERVRRAAIATGCAAAVMWMAIALSSVRWDFYRYLGGDLRRRGEPEAALEAYLHGERYAPKGESRRDRIEQLRRQLQR